MLSHLSIAAISALMLASSEQPTPGASVGAGNPYPVSNYKCKDGTHLAVRLLGDRASVSVNGATAVELPSMGPDGTTFSNGRQTLSIVQGSYRGALAGPFHPNALEVEFLVSQNTDAADCKPKMLFTYEIQKCIFKTY